MKTFAFALAGIAATACIAVAATAPAPKAAIGALGFYLAGMDRSVKPGDDFFDYANGTWFKNTEIPADRTSIGSFQELRILSEKRMGELIADLHAKAPATLTAEEHQILDLYDGFTDTAGIEARGLAPLKADLARINGLKTLDDVATLMGDPAAAASLNGDSIVADRIGADPKNSNIYVVFATQSGLGMPNRDYYLKTDDAGITATRDAYKKYLVQILGLAGVSKNAEARAAAVYALEEDMAKAEWASAARRDADKTYNPMTVAQLQRLCAGLRLARVLQGPGHRRGPQGDRAREHRLRAAGPNLRQDAAGGVEGLPDDPYHPCHVGLSAQGDRRRRFRLLRQGGRRPGAAIAARNARGDADRPGAAASVRQALCRQVLPAGDQGRRPRRSSPTSSRPTTPTSARSAG